MKYLFLIFLFLFGCNENYNPQSNIIPTKLVLTNVVCDYKIIVFLLVRLLFQIVCMVEFMSLIIFYVLLVILFILIQLYGNINTI